MKTIYRELLAKEADAIFKSKGLQNLTAAEAFDAAIESDKAKEAVHNFEVKAASLIKPLYDQLKNHCYCCKSEPQEGELNCEKCATARLIAQMDTF